MASTTNFNTTNSTYRQLMGNGLSYRIPPFQRDYSWTDEEWEDLWLDILGTIADGGEPAHYMGYLVLQTDDSKTFDVIDGQQRLTTISLIVLAVLKNLQRLVDAAVESDNNQVRLDQIRNSYVGFLNPVSLVPQSKLILNRNNDHYYQTYLVPLRPLPLRGFRASEHSLRKAFDWFDRRVSEYSRKQPGDEGTTLASFVERMSDRLFFTVITVTDELNAYKVFETLNARGVRLSATDLLKNYLFSVLHRGGQHAHELKIFEDRWENVVGRLGSESFPDFLRVHWNSRHAAVRQTELFKTIRSNVAAPDQAFALMRDIEADLDTFLGLTQPEGSTWPAEWKEHVGLLKMFSVRQPYPLLLAVRRTMGDDAFAKILRACVVISFRYNVIGGQATGEQETVYGLVTRGVLEGEFSRPADVVAGLSRIYPADAVFREAFAARAIRTTQPRNKRIVRYILCRFEAHLTGTELDFGSDAVGVEHVLPQNPADGWEAFPENETDEYLFRLGNMTLLETGKNRDLGNADFLTKREVYLQSTYEITRRLAEESKDWTPEQVTRRQAWMAKQATSLWRI